MTRDQAVKKLLKLYGKKACYRVDEKAGDAFDREQAQEHLKSLNKQKKEVDERLDARRKELLATDAEYQRILAEWMQLRQQQNALMEAAHSYRFAAGYIDGYLGAFHVDGQGDTWEQVFEELKKKYPNGKARLSSSDPNLQNIPIRTELGREIRRAFVADPGHVLVSADYSQIELRVLAHLSGDETLIEAFRRGDDIHGSP